jgi:hypothetical protein
MSNKISRDEFVAALFVLETVRDTVETTNDENEIVTEAHSIVQEYYHEGEL